MRLNAVNIIKENISMFDVLKKYGYSKNRSGFMCCPFHNEKTPSMKIYQKDYHCFGCGEHGDIISFVGKLFNLDFKETLKKIDIDFGLNLYGEHSFEEVRQSYYKQKKLQAERERKKQEQERANNEYWVAFGELARLDKNRREFAPQTPNEEWHPLFVEALQKTAYQEYLVELLDIRRCKCE